MPLMANHMILLYNIDAYPFPVGGTSCGENVGIVGSDYVETS